MLRIYLRRVESKMIQVLQSLPRTSKRIFTVSTAPKLKAAGWPSQWQREWGAWPGHWGPGMLHPEAQSLACLSRESTSAAISSMREPWTVFGRRDIPSASYPRCKWETISFWLKWLFLLVSSGAVIRFLNFHISPKLEDTFLKPYFNAYIKKNAPLPKTSAWKENLSHSEARMSVSNFSRSRAGTHRYF